MINIRIIFFTYADKCIILCRLAKVNTTNTEGFNMLIRDPSQDIARVLFSEDAIADRVRELADELTERFRGERPVLVCVLKGAVFFFVDLCRRMDCPLDMDFISVSSYGKAAASSGVVRLLRDLDHDIAGRHVVIVEDIVDSGLTMAYLKQLFGARKPASVSSVSFLQKEGAQQPVDYCGFSVQNEFLVGYGLDYAEHYRNLPYIGVLKTECYC